MVSPRFKVTREGRFEIKIVEGNQCGLRGVLGFDYKWSFASDKLDARQFVVDHHEVEKAIKEWSGKGKFKGSCEQVAIALAEIILSQVQIKGKDAYQYLTVELVTKGLASIEVSGTPAHIHGFSPKLEVHK